MAMDSFYSYSSPIKSDPKQESLFSAEFIG